VTLPALDYLDQRRNELLGQSLSTLDAWHENYVVEWRHRLHASVLRECAELKRRTAKA
jgi:hypothetical protein